MTGYISRLHMRRGEERSTNVHCKSMNLPKHLQGMTNDVGLTFSVGDTSSRFIISIEKDI